MKFKYPLYAILAACALAAGFSAPATAADPDKRSDRAERKVERDTPYSNRSVRRQREIERTVRDIERRESNREGYRFKSDGRRKPD